MKDYINKYGRKEVLEAHKKAVAFQAGGEAPATQEQAGGGVNPEELISAFLQAVQNNDQEGACKAAMAFTGAIAEQYMAQQQQAAGTPAMRKGGVMPEFKFDENGELIK